MPSYGIARIMSKPDFDADKFVQRQAQDGVDGLKELRNEITNLSDETSIALKKNVYKHYSQFIETAKEISILESEMYKLNHMLSDQKNIMNTMMEHSVTGDKIDSVDEQEVSEEVEPQKNLAFLLEKVEGCSSVTEVPGRTLVHDGDLIELDPETLTQINHVHAFLLNDSLMLAEWLPQRRGPVKYRYQVLYELDGLAVVNNRDLGGCKNAFNVLIFPDHRMFQAESQKAKRHWLTILDETKWKKTVADKQRKENLALGSVEKTRAPSFANDESNPFADDVNEPPNPFDEPVMPQFTPQVEDTVDLLHEDWVQELPEDLDVCIAQRDFEGAADLIRKVNEHLENCEKSAAVKEYRSRVEHRIKQLTEALVQELRVSPERSIRGGPRAVRRAVTQLVRLGKSSQACDLFLKNRSAIFKHNLLQLKLEGSTAVYIKRLSEVFFKGLLETGEEFIKAFPKHNKCYSAFIIWGEEEVSEFAKKFQQQVFVNKATLTSIAECVKEAKISCDMMHNIGLDATFILDSAVLPQVQGIVKATVEKHTENLKSQVMDDLWRPVNFQNEAHLDKFEKEMDDLYELDIRKYSYDGCFSYLTSNTIQFTRTYLSLCKDLLNVHCQELHENISNAISEMFMNQLKHADRCIRAAEFKQEHKIITLNTEYLVESLLPKISEKYTEVTGLRLPRSSEMQFILQKIRSITKQLTEQS